MTRVFTHPSGNGYAEKTGTFASILLVALFGPLYLLIRHAWLAALTAVPVEIAISVAAIILGGSQDRSVAIFFLWIAFAQWALGMAMQAAIARAYLRRGWREITPAPAARTAQT